MYVFDREQCIVFDSAIATYSALPTYHTIIPHSLGKRRLKKEKSCEATLLSVVYRRCAASSEIWYKRFLVSHTYLIICRDDPDVSVFFCPR